MYWRCPLPNRRRCSRPICEKFGFSGSMRTIVGSPPVGDWEKADVIRETMRRLGLNDGDKSQILMVGDRKFDVLGAKACGIDCVGVEFFRLCGSRRAEGGRRGGSGLHGGRAGAVYFEPLMQKRTSHKCGTSF